MGLLDWLTEGVGSDMGGSSMGSGMQMPPGMPPMQQTGVDAPPLQPGGANAVDPMGNGTGVNPMTAPPPPTPFPPGMDPMTAGGAPPNGPGLPPPPVPMPMARPPGADAAPPPPPLPMARPPGADAGALPPNAAPTGGGMPPMSPQDASGIAQSYQNAGGNLAPPAAPPGATGFIGRALGLDANREASMRGSLGAGLKAAGENANKPGLAAFAGSMGSGIEGGKAATDKTTDQQSKYLNDAIKAKQSGDLGKLNIARTRLALAQAKAAEKDTKASVQNSEQQLYLRADKQALGEAQVSANGVKQALVAAGGDVNNKDYKKALDAHKAELESLKKQQYAKLGLDPAKAAQIAKQPGMTIDNPVPAAGLTQQKFDELPVGAHFINPKDNRLLIKQPPGGANQTPQAQSPTPAAPVPVTAPAGSLVDQENDD